MSTAESQAERGRCPRLGGLDPSACRTLGFWGTQLENQGEGEGRDLLQAGHFLWGPQTEPLPPRFLLLS